MTAAGSDPVTAAGSRVWFLVPEGIDDPARVSGGNVFDQRAREGLAQLGLAVQTVEVPADAASPAADALARVPEGGLVLVDGLVAVRSAEALEAAAEGLRIVVLAHMVVGAFADADPGALEAERRALGCARRVIVTSRWARDELTNRGLVDPDRIVVATPGSDDAPAAVGTSTGGSLLCVGVVAPHKGQDTLVDALVQLGSSLPWTCTIVGSTAADPEFAARVTDRADSAGLSGRITWAGVLAAGDLDAVYSRADLLVAPSRTESYGMAVSDALRRGIPVVASRVGGIPEAVEPGGAAVLVPPGRPDALGDALRRWIVDPAERARMIGEARRARSTRPRWSDTVRTLHTTLGGVS